MLDFFRYIYCDLIPFIMDKIGWDILRYELIFIPIALLPMSITHFLRGYNGTND